MLLSFFSALAGKILQAPASEAPEKTSSSFWQVPEDYAFTNIP